LEVTSATGKRALVTGVTGQDGAYITKLLLSKGYKVIGALRRTPTSNVGRLDELGIAQDIELVDFDLLEFRNLLRLVEITRPDEIYNLAAQSLVGLSFGQPIYTAECNATGVSRLFEAVRTVNPKIRFYQASSSEMFGRAAKTPQSETSPFCPCSPYAISKLFSHWTTVNYRESYGMHATSGILFNHESPLRGPEYVTRKITISLAKIKHGKLDILRLGNLDAHRDWGFAPDYVEGIWLMLQQAQASDYVLATGVAHSVRDFVVAAANRLDFDIVFEGTGVEERGIDRRTGHAIVQVDPKLFRPQDVDYLCGDPAKAERQLGWTPKASFAQIVSAMAEADNRRVRDSLLTLA
jgi:GDPmannose 4,6-dehydratase